MKKTLQALIVAGSCTAAGALQASEAGFVISRSSAQEGDYVAAAKRFSRGEEGNTGTLRIAATSPEAAKEFALALEVQRNELLTASALRLKEAEELEKAKN